MSKVKVVMGVDVEGSVPPKGYKFTGEHRVPEEGELYLSANKQVLKMLLSGPSSSVQAPILERGVTRAEIYTQYYYITVDMVVQPTGDSRDPIDDALYEAGNYFLTRLQAEEALAKIKNILLGDRG